MLKTRVIPTLLWKDLGLVKGIGFNSWRRVGPALPALKDYNHRDIDELVLMDVLANQQLEAPDFESMGEFGKECTVPLAVGGGIRSLDHVQRLIRAGADKVVLNTAAYTNPDLVTDIANRFGTQCVISSVDVRSQGKDWMCFSHSGTQTTGRSVRDWVRELEDRGAGEILLTSIERDGTMQGYDLELIRTVATCVNIPVIASGGAGNYQHLIDAIKKAGASAVAAASIFHFTELTPAGAKQAMKQAGISIREDFKEIHN